MASPHGTKTPPHRMDAGATLMISRCSTHQVNHVPRRRAASRDEWRREEAAAGEGRVGTCRGDVSRLTRAAVAALPQCRLIWRQDQPSALWALSQLRRTL